MFCIQSKNVFYYFRFINLHWCKTIFHVQNAQYTSCIHGWLFSLIYIFLLLYQKKKKKKSYTEHSIRNWLMIWGIPDDHYERTLHTIFKLYHWSKPITSIMTLPAVIWFKKTFKCLAWTHTLWLEQAFPHVLWVFSGCCQHHVHVMIKFM